MKRGMITFMMCSHFAWCGHVGAAGPVGNAFTYQGELKYNGTVVDGAVNMTFRLYDSQTGGNLFGTQIVNGVQVVGGRVQASLDFGSTAFNGAERWLEVDINGDTLSARQKLTANPYASFALNAPFVRQGNALLLDGGMSLGIGEASPIAAIDLKLNANQEQGVRVRSSSTSNWARCISGTLTAVGPGVDAAAVYGEVNGGLLANPNGVAVAATHVGSGIAMKAYSVYGTALQARSDGISGWAGDFIGRARFSNSVMIGNVSATPAALCAVWPGQVVEALESSHAAGTWLNMSNTSTNGNTWGLVSTGSGNSEGAGHFLVRNVGDGFTAMIIKDTGNMGVGTTNPGYKLHVNGSAGKPGGGSWSNASDIRLKKNIQPMGSVLDRLLSLRPVTFEYTDPDAIGELHGVQMGMIAQEVEQVFPQWVDEGDDGYKRLTFRGFEALTVASLRELRAERDVQLKSQEARIVELQAENAQLRDRLEAIESLVHELAQSRNGDVK